jgi:uncharacterized membrane protein
LKNPYLYSALVAAVSICAAKAGAAPAENNRIKCYGIAKAGENDCAGINDEGEKQGCPAWSLKDNDPRAWTYATREECNQKGGKLNPPPPPVVSKKPSAEE